MQPRIFKRWKTTLSPRKGRKGHLYGTDIVQPPPTPEEDVRILQRRHKKAERDERMDITRALTPPKTYMGGFTRPKDIRATHWFPGGPFVLKGKKYESPPEAAYEPHTVFLLESRYRVRHGVGRVDGHDHVTGVCRTVDFVRLMDKYNSIRCPHEARQSMDNACWPFIPKSGKVLKPTRWWGPDENLEEIMKEIYEDENYDVRAVYRALRESREEEVEEDDPAQPPKKKKRPATPSASDAAPASEKPQLPKISQKDTKITVDPEKVREMYTPHIRKEPFWRPLLAIGVSTRPLALTISRLAKAHERGLPFYAAMENADRKCLFSYSGRMTNYRINRFFQLTREMTRRLAGEMGGFVGIRFNTQSRGRGIGGESLADPIAADKRTVTVKVGNWYRRADELFESFNKGGLEWGGQGAVDVAYMTEWGRKLDAEGNEVPLTEEEMGTAEVEGIEESEDDEEEESEKDDEEESEQDDEDELDERDLDELEELGREEEERLLMDPHDPVRTRKFKPILRENNERAAALRRKLALRGAQWHRSVETV